MAYKLPPKPRKRDVVEKKDMSRMFGYVNRIHASENRIEVKWADGKKPEVTKENPKNLALVERRY